MRFILFILIILLFVNSDNPSSKAEAFQLKGDFIQGGLVFGIAPPEVKIIVNERKVRVSNAGKFIFGFGRNAAPTVKITLLFPNGKKEIQRFNLIAREYNIQRIDGLPENMVTPSSDVVERINRENREVKLARAFDTNATHFLQRFEWPVHGIISGVYGSQRILNGKPRQPHYGLDIVAPIGTVVRAPVGGVVRMAKANLYFSGGTVILDHGFGLSSSFLHLSKICVNKNDKLEKGHIIGAVGATGRVTGAHLDWRINWFEQRLDPQLLLKGNLSNEKSNSLMANDCEAITTERDAHVSILQGQSSLESLH